MTEGEFLIGELAKMTGVSVRTIRFYISEGLLPSPQTRGRYTVYDEEYLELLELIKGLKEAFLPIKEIRVMMETKSKVEIAEFLSHYERTRTPENDALDYIANVMENKQMVSDRSANLQIQSPSADMRTNRSEIPAARGASDINRGENWKRFEIIPGFEFHIIERKLNRNQRAFFKLIEEAKKLIK